jgi:hypothetical protein
MLGNSKKIHKKASKCSLFIFAEADQDIYIKVEVCSSVRLWNVGLLKKNLAAVACYLSFFREKHGKESSSCYLLQLPCALQLNDKERRYWTKREIF